jgi:hypothetical protein
LAAIIANINVIITALVRQPHNIGGFGIFAVYIGDNWLVWRYDARPFLTYRICF